MIRHIYWFIDAALRGASQVMFQNNPLTGFLFFIGIFWGSSEVGLASLTGLIIATLTARLFQFDAIQISQGLFGYNGLLVGAAVSSFMNTNELMWVCILVGSALSTPVTLGMTKALGKWPPLTFPFIGVSWVILGAARFFHDSMTLPSSFLNSSHAIGVELYLRTLSQNVSQVFLIENPITGIIFMIALGMNSLWALFFAVLGSAGALFLALLLRIELSDVEKGWYGFSAVLTAIALGSVFQKPSLRTTAYAVLGALITVCAHIGLNHVFSTFELPVLTAPFVFVTWLFLAKALKTEQ